MFHSGNEFPIREMKNDLRLTNFECTRDSHGNNFTFFETVLYCVAGGMLGVIAFTFFSRAIIMLWYWLKHQFKKIIHRKDYFSEPIADVSGHLEVKYNYLEKNQKQKIFTKSNRKIVKIWARFGLAGIALITPVILSIPIGTLIANSLVSDRRKIILYMFFSILFWSVLMTSMFELYHAVDLNDLKKHF